MYNTHLTNKQLRFVNCLIKGKTLTEAYIWAYNTKGHKPTVYSEASRTARLPHVRQAIEYALIANDATPEYAVSQLKKVIEQDDNYGAKRAAIIDLLELMGIKR